MLAAPVTLPNSVPTSAEFESDVTGDPKIGG